MDKKKIRLKIKQYLLVLLGVLLLDIGFYFFMDPAKIVLGGMMGLSILLEPFYSQLGQWFTASVFLFIMNTITLIIGGICLGKDFFFKTIASSLVSPLIVFIFERLFDPNYFLNGVSAGGYYIVALICGAALSGTGLGLAIKNNGCTGGLDVVQRIMSKYMHVPHSITMYLTDGIIVILSGLVFVPTFMINIEMIIYGVLGVMAVSILIDRIVLNAKSRRTAYIITNRPNDVKKMIYDTIDRGVTFVNVEGGYTGDKKTMIMCTMDKNQAYKINEILKKDFPETFSFLTATREILGAYDEHYKNDESK